MTIWKRNREGEEEARLDKYGIIMVGKKLLSNRDDIFTIFQNEEVC